MTARTATTGSFRLTATGSNCCCGEQFTGLYRGQYGVLPDDTLNSWRT